MLFIAMVEAIVAFALYWIMHACVIQEPDSVVHLITSLIFLGATLIFLFAVVLWSGEIMGRYRKETSELERASAHDKQRIRELEDQVAALTSCWSGPGQVPSPLT
jgi:hypothetical protein